MEPLLTCLALIHQLIAKFKAWRSKTFASIRKSILEADLGDNRAIEVDGRSAVASRRNDRGRQRPQRQRPGEAYLFLLGRASQILTSSSTRVSKATRGEL